MKYFCMFILCLQVTCVGHQGLVRRGPSGLTESGQDLSTQRFTISILNQQENGGIELIERYLQELTKINSWLSEFAPQHTKLEIDFDRALVLSHAAKIDLVKLGLQNELSLSNHLATWVHEFGHIVCNFYFNDHLNEFKTKMNEFESLTVEIERTKQEVIKKVNEIGEPNNLNSFNAVKNAYTEGQKKIFELRTKFNFESNSLYRRRYEPYSELCADVFSVIHFQDLKIMTLLGQPNDWSEKEKESRDFSLIHKNVEHLKGKDGHYLGHPYLAPVRTEIGKCGVDKLSSDNEKKYFFAVFLKNLTEHMNSEPLNSDQFEPIRENEELKRRLTQCK